MEVILLERIEKLGQMGDVVNVKPGFARNFLLPQKKAMRASEENKSRFADQRAQLEAANIERRGEAAKVGEKMENLMITLIRQAGEAGQLYGSVNAGNVADEVTAAGFTVDRKQVELPHPIKALGVYTVRVNLHPDVSIGVGVNVARTEDEAKFQAKTGKAVVRIGEDDGKAAEKAAKADKATAAIDEEAIQEQAEEIFEKPEEEIEKVHEEVLEEGGETESKEEKPAGETPEEGGGGPEEAEEKPQ